MEELGIFLVYLFPVVGFVFSQVYLYFWDLKDQQRAYEEAREDERRRSARAPRFGR